MADTPDRDSRTEEATEKRILDAVREGNTPVSREAMPFAIFLSALVATVFMVSEAAERLTNLTLPFIENPGAWRLTTGREAQSHLLSLLYQIGLIVLPILCLFMAIGVAAACLNGVPRFAVERIRPKLDRLSLQSGFKRLFQMGSLAELGRALLKLFAVIGIGIWISIGQVPHLGRLIDVDAGHLPGALLSVIQSVLIYLVLFSGALLAADLVFVRFKWHHSLRMTKQQVKDEHRQSDGDPQLKMRRKAVGRERARKRNLTAVPKATVVIVNPTHFAVALRYSRQDGGAPVVLAKGQDLLALAIRRIAEARKIAVIEDKSLARSLYAQVEVGQQIPTEFFRAVADILLSLQKRGKIRLN